MEYVIIALVGVFVSFLIIKYLCNLLRACRIRLRFYRRLKRLCKEKKYTLKKKRLIFASFLRCSKKPDLIVETPNEKYAVSFITSKSRKTYVRFITQERYIRTVRAFWVLLFSVKVAELFRYSGMKKAPKKPNADSGLTPVLLFNPAPLEISYLAPNGVRLTGNRQEMFGWKLFDATGFLEHLKFFV